MNTKKKLLEIQSLSVFFRDPEKPLQEIRAVQEVSMDILEGSFTSVVGESGSGKTVLSLSVTGLERSYRKTGQILWHGGEAKIRYVFQDSGQALNPVRRIGWQIGELGFTRREVLEYLEYVQMQDPQRVYQSYPHELSGGMRQRALIAMALIAKPRLLIADEPTSSLDAEVELEILKLLERIKKEKNLTLLFITHNMAQALEHSDHIAVMHQGRMVETLERGGRGFCSQDPPSKKTFCGKFLEGGPSDACGD